MESIFLSRRKNLFYVKPGESYAATAKIVPKNSRCTKKDPINSQLSFLGKPTHLPRNVLAPKGLVLRGSGGSPRVVVISQEKSPSKLAPSVSFNAIAFSIKNGAYIHDKVCTSCHTTNEYVAKHIVEATKFGQDRQISNVQLTDCENFYWKGAAKKGSKGKERGTPRKLRSIQLNTVKLKSNDTSNDHTMLH